MDIVDNKKLIIPDCSGLVQYGANDKTIKIVNSFNSIRVGDILWKLNDEDVTSYLFTDIVSLLQTVGKAEFDSTDYGIQSISWV